MNELDKHEFKEFLSETSSMLIKAKELQKMLSKLYLEADYNKFNSEGVKIIVEALEWGLSHTTSTKNND